MRSQNNPVFGIYLNLSIFLMSSKFLISDDIPPWMHRNLLLTSAARGRLSNSYITFSYTSWSYFNRPLNNMLGTFLSEIEKGSQLSALMIASQ